MNPPHVLGIPVDVNPPCPRNSSGRNPPSPSEFRDATRGMGMDIFWNHPIKKRNAQKSEKTACEKMVAIVKSSLINKGSLCQIVPR